MLIIKLFGFTIATAALFTSVAMIIMGGKWQKIEQSAYGGSQRPWWFIVLSVLIIAFYMATVVSFIGIEKTWASWAMVVIIPVGWGLKAAVIVFNSKGREKVSSISGDKSWVKIGLARLPIAALFYLLAMFS